MTETNMPPLDLDLNSVDTSMPLINGGNIVDFVAVKVEKKTTSDGTTPMLSIDWKSTGPTTDVKGQPLNAGVHLFDNVMLAPSGKSNWDMVVRNIASVVQAAGLQTNLNDFLQGGYSSLQGAAVRIKVGFVPEGPDKKGIHRRAKNEVSVYMKVS
jgi:hypothetical protein